MFRNKSLIAIKYAMVCSALLLMAILAFSVVKKASFKVRQKEETVPLDIKDKVNISSTNENHNVK